MYELIQTGDRTWYIDCPAKIGVFRSDSTGVTLIDSGNDRDAARKILKILQGQGWELKAIVNTHSNADHIGGNRYLQEKTGCRIFAKGLEVMFTRFPEVESAFLYGGFPTAELRNKFLLADPSQALDISDPGFPEELEPISLEGHFFHMMGLRTPDDVVFLADSLSSPLILDKYHVTFIYDVKEYLNTLDRIEAMEARLFVPSHADAVEDIRPTVKANRDKVWEIAESLLEICRSPFCFEDILQKVFDQYQLTMNFNQYVLVGSTIRSYLAWLKESGRLTACFEQNRLLWETVK